MAAIILLGGIFGAVWIGNKILNCIDDLNSRRSEIERWTKLYAAEKVSINNIHISEESIDALLSVAIDNALTSQPISEDIYKQIYIKYVEKRMREADEHFKQL